MDNCLEEEVEQDRMQQISNDHELSLRNERIDVPEFYIIKATVIGNRQVKIRSLFSKYIF